MSKTAMTKSQLLKHLQNVAERATPRKRLNGVHVRAITDELMATWTRSLQETGTASFPGLGRFRIDKRSGVIKFKASTLWEDKIAGNVTSSRRHSGFDADDVEDEDDSDDDDDEYGSHGNAHPRRQ
ncbi:TPA: hypothetical protein N0F65_002521 [Lagenidium giganteum]|uniref:Uncharacterized protein n=1 Tax=Lagenidium giganteum TaxID=4803 RepID=A0AAV2YNH3_9STRA|nr:TPA: hypothetical protein N0F65_002521 [Lagenidium giganteum]